MSRGSISSRQNSSTQSSFFWNSGSVEKSHAMAANLRLHIADSLAASRLMVRFPLRPPTRTEPVGSVRPGHPEGVLGEVGQDQVVGDRRDLVEPGLAELPFDVVVGGEAE